MVIPIPYHSILITGGAADDRRKVAENLAGEVSKFDTHILATEDHQAIGIDAIRQIIHQVNLRPGGKEPKVVIIPEAQFLTIEAQNALLKNLEEPPAHSLIILTVPYASDLLPTVVSRCQIRELKTKGEFETESEEILKAEQEFLRLLEKNHGERLIWCDQNKAVLGDGHLAEKALAIWIMALRKMMLDRKSEPDPGRVAEWITLGLTLMKRLRTTNISPRLALEYFLLSLPTSTR